MTQRLYIEDIASRLEARPDVYVTAAAELLRSLAKDIDTTKQAKADIAAAWVAGYYHAGYTYDGAYADKMSDEFAAEWCEKAAQPYTVADCKASEERWAKKIDAQPAKPDVEPVAWLYFHNRGEIPLDVQLEEPDCIKSFDTDVTWKKPLFTTPPDTEALRKELERVKSERDHARAQYENTIKILTGIHALLYPSPITLADGRTMAFRPKDAVANEFMQELSDRIRAIPDAIAQGGTP